MTYQSIRECNTAILSVIGKVPADLVEGFTEEAADPVPPKQIVGCAEFIFAHRDKMPKEVIECGVGLANFAAQHEWMTLRGERGTGVMMALMNKAGQKAPTGTKFAKAADEPDPLERLVPAEPEEVEEEEPEAEPAE